MLMPPANAPYLIPSAPPTRRLRVLVGAYALSPVRGSEPGVGWGICRALADLHDVTVLCSAGTPGTDHDIYRREIEAHLAQHGPIPGLNLHYIPRPRLSQWLQREDEHFRRTFYYTGYQAWQKAALAEARRLHAERPFDIVHQLNITGFREPGYLWKLSAPFVWGPIGGGANIPLSYFPIMDRRDRVYYAFRNVWNEVQKRLAIRCRIAAARAKHLWTIGHQTQDMVEHIWRRRSEIMLEMGCTARAEAHIRTRNPRMPLRIVWSAIHVGRKALPILLRALHALGPHAPVEAVVLGGGPLTAAWLAEAERLGLGHKIRFAGKLSLADALSEVRTADVMAFTSVQEGTPAAVLEALSLGLPVICHDACGMGVAVDDRCGIKVPMVSVSGSIAGFAAAIRRLIDEPELLRRLSAGALERTAELDWRHKAARMDEVYQRIVGAVVASGTPGARASSPAIAAGDESRRLETSPPAIAGEDASAPNVDARKERRS